MRSSDLSIGHIPLWSANTNARRSQTVYRWTINTLGTVSTKPSQTKLSVRDGRHLYFLYRPFAALPDSGKFGTAKCDALHLPHRVITSTFAIALPICASVSRGDWTCSWENGLLVPPRAHCTRRATGVQTDALSGGCCCLDGPCARDNSDCVREWKYIG